MKPLVSHRGAAPDKPLNRWFPPSLECPHWRWGTLEDEVQETTKRLRKQDDKRTWDTTEIFRARGYTAEETAGYIDVLPNRALICNAEEPNT
jgi:hypothetical protein